VIFFDTNVLVYSTINLDENKQKTADRLIEQAIKDKLFSASPLVLSEFIFVLSKLNIDKKLVEKAISLYKPFVNYPLEPSMVLDAYELCSELGLCKNINDAVHVKFAEKYCSRIVTFDGDFNKFKDSTSIKVEVLHSIKKSETAEKKI
jgi:predicted nucleic acid-binding protein